MHLPISNSFIFLQNSVITRNLVVGVSQNGDLHFSETSMLPGSVDPGQMGEFGIRGSSKDLNSKISELLSTIREGNNLSRANKGAEKHKYCIYKWEYKLQKSINYQKTYKSRG